MKRNPKPETVVPLKWRNVTAVPLIHGRLPFAVWVRERMLAERYGALAVELPESLRLPVLAGIERLPVIHAVLYHEEEPSFLRAGSGGFGLGEEGGPERTWYVPIDPCDGIVEGLRIAVRERVPMHFVDAEVEQFSGRPVVLPDSHALLTLGLSTYYDAVLEQLRDRHPPTEEDEVRERHMAARLHDLSRKVGEDRRVLFLCGIAHWERIRRQLERRAGVIHSAEGPREDAILLWRVDEASLVHMLGETPFATHSYERHRSGFSLEQHDQVLAVKELLLEARAAYLREERPASLEKPTPAALRGVLHYARKLTLAAGRLTPDLYTLVVAAKGVVGNDFALHVLDVARGYPPNRVAEPPEESSPAAPAFEEGDTSEDFAEPWDAGESPYEAVQPPPDEPQRLTEFIPRTPGDWRELKRVRLEDRPPEVDQERWRSVWNPYHQCSYPPEDILIENLRSYVSSRCLSMAGIDRARSEEFTASLKDGLAIRETLRDLPLGKVHVRVEPRVPGRVGAVVIIFEEDDAGERYRWRTTWMAEHEGESTLAFYATSYLDDIVGPGIGRARYGGCMMIYPPILIEDVWEDLRFEKARRPSERLLLAAAFYARERFIAHVSARPPAPEVQATAQAMGKHIVHLPLSSFSTRTLEKIRRVHVLNGQIVRSWAARFIR